ASIEAAGAGGVAAAVVLVEAVAALVAEDEAEAVALVVGDGAIDMRVVRFGPAGGDVETRDAAGRVEIRLVVAVQVEASGAGVVGAALVDVDRHGRADGSLADVMEGGGEAAGLPEGPVVRVVVAPFVPVRFGGAGLVEDIVAGGVVALGVQLEVRR